MGDTTGAGQKRIKSLIAPPDAHMAKKRRDTTGASQGEIKNTLVFPSDLSTHYMAMQFYRYVFKDNSFQKRTLHKTILLPVPLTLVEAINIEYNDSALGGIRGELSDMAAQGDIEGAMATGVDLVGGALKGASNVAFGGGGIAGLRDRVAEQGANLGLGALLIPGARSGTGAVAAGLNRYFGSAPNPHITTLFQGVGFRQHNFNWKLAPADREESKTLAQIIDSLRASALPERGAGNFTLNFPDECEIYIMGTSANYMYHFKTAVIKAMSTNFAPDGVLSFFGETGAPTAVTIDLQLGETVLHTREDYDPATNFEGADQPDRDIMNSIRNIGTNNAAYPPLNTNPGKGQSGPGGLGS